MSNSKDIACNRTALITGASRGIGASVARQLARDGMDIGINYRSKGPRAQQVADEIVASGQRALLLQADITNPDEVSAMFRRIEAAWKKLDFLILNASGGLEQGRAADYAMRLNLTAQINVVNSALPLMGVGARIVFVTSHLAHFYGTGSTCEGYEVVAASKRAGEDALRAMIPELTTRGIRLVVVSGDLIEGTITPKLLERQNRGLIMKRKQAVGVLPSVEEFATAITLAATSDAYSHGETIFVGSTNEGEL